MPKIQEKIPPIDEGYAARTIGLTLKDNPYKAENNYNCDHHKWERGWYEAHYEIQQKQEQQEKEKLSHA